MHCAFPLQGMSSSETDPNNPRSKAVAKIQQIKTQLDAKQSEIKLVEEKLAVIVNTCKKLGLKEMDEVVKLYFEFNQLSAPKNLIEEKESSLKEIIKRKQEEANVINTEYQRWVNYLQKLNRVIESIGDKEWDSFIQIIKE